MTLNEGSQEDPALQKILRLIAELSPADQTLYLKALQRYDGEAAKNGYRSDPSALLAFIEDKKLLRDSTAVTDLGAGPGDLVEALAQRNRELTITGLDLSPGFVRNFNRSRALPNASMDVGLIDRPLPDIDPDNEASVLSVLTLDRLAYPTVLVENMSRFTKARILATLLPIVPEDDNPSMQMNKIIYTRDDNRIVPGRNENEDRQVLTQVLEQSWKAPVAFAKVPYEVTSSGDRQAYELGVFFTS